MATRTWTGAAGDGSFSAVGNWATGVVPVTGDAVIVLESATSGMSTNLNRSADGAGAGLNLIFFEVQAGFAYNIGSVAAPLRLTADVFTDRGNGSTYFQSDTGTAALPTDRVIIDKEGFGGIVVIASSGDSDITKIEVTRGSNVTIGDEVSGMTITDIWLAPRGANDVVRVTGLAGNTVSGYIHVAGGEFIVDGIEPNVINLDNGLVEFRKSTIPVLNQGGGLFLHNGEASNYAVSEYNAKGGYIDTSRTAGGKLISVLNRVPTFVVPRNPKLTITTETFIGG